MSGLGASNRPSGIHFTFSNIANDLPVCLSGEGVCNFRMKEATVSRSDTRIGNAESDTLCLKFVSGQRVRVATGSMKGLEGTFVENRSVGRVLIRVHTGICVEIHQYCLELVSKKKS